MLLIVIGIILLVLLIFYWWSTDATENWYGWGRRWPSRRYLRWRYGYLPYAPYWGYGRYGAYGKYWHRSPYWRSRYGYHPYWHAGFTSHMDDAPCDEKPYVDRASACELRVRDFRMGDAQVGCPNTIGYADSGNTTIPGHLRPNPDYQGVSYELNKTKYEPSGALRAPRRTGTQGTLWGPVTYKLIYSPKYRMRHSNYCPHPMLKIFNRIKDEHANRYQENGGLAALAKFEVTVGDVLLVSNAYWLEEPKLVRIYPDGQIDNYHGPVSYDEVKKWVKDLPAQ